MSTSIYTSLPWHNYYGLFSLIWYILLAAGLYRTFEKAGEKGWKAIIPIYNLYICFQISGRSSYFVLWAASTVLAALCSWMSGFALLFWMGIVGWVLSVVAVILLASMWYSLAVAFGHGILFGLGLIFFNPLFIMILGYGSSSYRFSRYWH